MNPLQEKANLLRASMEKQAAEQKGYQQQHKQTVGEQLTYLFSSDFPELYQLLIQSQVSIAGAINHQGQQVVLSLAGKELSVFYERMKSEWNIWRFHGKDYRASSTESEQRLIIALAEAFSQAQTKHMAGK